MTEGNQREQKLAQELVDVGKLSDHIVIVQPTAEMLAMLPGRKLPTTISVLAELDNATRALAGIDSTLRGILCASDENNLTENEAAGIASAIHDAMDKLAALARFVEGRE